MVTCSVLDCDINQRNNPAKYSFHRFPTNEDVRKTWLKLINRPNWIPTKYATLCSKHFDSKCFRKIGARITLKKCAIPTEFVPMKVKPTRTMSSYVNRDILPEGSTLSS
ncbi:THAP domain-containing protein 2-like [Ostrinia furnacalis]|uniref:THAP domain-containing protein 2-like n=1 Tax=Ostrinia furnacalis TaxID=93504 RepID=UPI0010406217|nr:THAP domain-containing protein 2-like [Ostrinia furnacalis]